MRCHDLRLDLQIANGLCHHGDASSLQNRQTFLEQLALALDEYPQFEVCEADPTVQLELVQKNQMMRQARLVNLACGGSSRHETRGDASLVLLSPRGADRLLEILMCCRLRDRRQNRWYP